MSDEESAISKNADELRAAARRNCRVNGIESTCIGLWNMTSVEGVFESQEQYIALVSGIADEIIRER